MGSYCHALRATINGAAGGPVRYIVNEMKTAEKLPPIAVNRKARFDYFIEERFEAGISLMGWEVKSMRAGKAQIAEAYVYVKNGEAFLFGAHFESAEFGLHPRRDRSHAHTQAAAQPAPARSHGRRGGAARLHLVPLELYWKAAAPSSRSGSPRARSSTTSAPHEKDRDWQRDKGRIMKAMRR